MIINHSPKINVLVTIYETAKFYVRKNEKKKILGGNIGGPPVSKFGGGMPNGGMKGGKGLGWRFLPLLWWFCVDCSLLLSPTLFFGMVGMVMFTVLGSSLFGASEKMVEREIAFALFF